ncbi:hypothetical protein A5692_01375 [Mycobacterium sp. E342]|nr:hypothetical protein A5692_01375 [Mycobacterium sp. E342]
MIIVSDESIRVLGRKKPSTPRCSTGECGQRERALFSGGHRTTRANVFPATPITRVNEQSG